jgi:hypothetical protein
MINVIAYLILLINYSEEGSVFLSRENIHQKLWDAYCIDPSNLDFLNIELIEKSVKKTDRLNNHLGFLLEYLQNDKKNLKEIKIIQHNALKTINDNTESIYQLGVMFYNSTKDEQLEVFKKALESGEYIRNACAEKKSLLPYFWYSHLRMLSDGPFNQVDEITKAKFLKEQILPFFDSLLTETGARNAYIDECRMHCRCMIYVFEENFNTGYLEIEKLKKSRLRLVTKDDASMAIPTILRLSLLLKEKKYSDVINEFKSLPPKWLDIDEKPNRTPMFIFSRIAADAYFEIGNIEASKTWREIAISLNYSNDFKSNRDISLQDAIKLRDIYIKEKSWALMRSLEERSAKFGMKALPKQVGEK